MIPKVIHYCWFGGKPLTKLAKKCISSWRKYCPDYEIKRWDETNFDYTKNLYMRQAYEAKKWGFVPDYARLDIIYNYGGIYLDTDVELIKSLDDLLGNKAFCGFEAFDLINLGQGFAAEPKNPIIKQLMEPYDNLCFQNKDGTLNLIPSPIIQTKEFESQGLLLNGQIQEIKKSIIVYPKDYFNPINANTGKTEITADTYSIHHFAASWESKYSIFRGKIFKFLYRTFGEKTAITAKKIFGRKYS